MMANKVNGRVIRLLVLAGALIMVIVGVCSGEVGTVLTKAVNICLECIGIG
jgi:hypothetical protein